MKTGGSMNFLKRAGAIFMFIAIFASSCNKYADDFKQVNTKLDALASQIAGVATLSTDITALKTQVTALQTAIAGMPSTASITALSTALTGVNTKIDAITTALNSVTASGTANATAIAGVKTDLAALVASQATVNAAATAAFAAEAAKLTALDTKMTGIVAQITAIGVQETALAAAIATNNTAIAANATALVALAAQQTTLAANLAALVTATSSADAIAVSTAATNAAAAATANAALALQAAQIISDLAANTSADALTASVIAGLQTSLAAQKLTLDAILANQIIPLTGVTVAVTTAGDQIQNGIQLTATTVPAGMKATYVWNTAASGSATAALTPIAAAADTSVYTLTSAEVGKYIVVQATGKGNNVSTIKRSTATTIVLAQAPITLLTIGGTGANVTAVGAIVVDSTLTAIVTPPLATVDYLWESAAAVSGPWTALTGTAKTHKIVAGDFDKYIRVSATGKGGFIGSLTSAATAKVTSTSAVISGTFGFTTGQNVLTITVAGATFRTGTFSATDFTFTGTDGPTFANAGVWTRVDDNNVKFQLLATFGVGNLNTVQIKTSALVGLATSVTATPGTAVAFGTTVGTAITGVTAPVTGATYVTTATVSSGATATVSWSPAVASTFLAGTVYTATITVTPSVGFTLIGVAANGFSVNGGTATNAINSGTVTKTFPATAAASLIVISQGNLLSYLPLPVAGAGMATTVTDSQYTGTVTWTNNNGGNNTGSFSPGTVYTGTAVLTPTALYTLLGTSTNLFTVTGASSVTHVGGSNTVTVVYPTTATLSVPAQTLAGISRPVAGTSTSTTPNTAPTGVGFTSSIISWTDTTTPTAVNWTSADAAVATFTLSAISGYTFDATSIIAITGFTNNLVGGATGITRGVSATTTVP